MRKVSISKAFQSNADMRMTADSTAEDYAQKSKSVTTSIPTKDIPVKARVLAIVVLTF